MVRLKKRNEIWRKTEGEESRLGEYDIKIKEE